jgi:hypothetical protein
MADWDKAAEQIDEIHRTLDEILALTKAGSKILAEIPNRPLPWASAPTEGYPAPALLDRLHGIERRLSGLQRDQTQAEIGQIERGTRVLQLDGQLRELERRLTRLEEMVHYPGKPEGGP